MIRYSYFRRIEPPAPFLYVTLQNPADVNALRDVPAQVDCAADRTVLPETLVHALGPPQMGTMAVAGLGGSIQILPTFAVLVGIHDLPIQPVKAVASAGETWVLLGRDILNAHRILLDGPGLALEIG